MFKEGVQHPPFFIAISASTYLLTALLFRRASLFPAAKVAASLPSCKHRSYSVTRFTAAFPFSFSLRFQQNGYSVNFARNCLPVGR